MRPYAGEADLEAIAHLINACEAVDRTDSGTSVSELRQSFDDPSVDKARNIYLWEDAENQLVGLGGCGFLQQTKSWMAFWGFASTPRHEAKI